MTPNYQAQHLSVFLSWLLKPISCLQITSKCKWLFTGETWWATLGKAVTKFSLQAKTEKVLFPLAFPSFAWVWVACSNISDLILRWLSGTGTPLPPRTPQAKLHKTGGCNTGHASQKHHNLTCDDDPTLQGCCSEDGVGLLVLSPLRIINSILLNLSCIWISALSSLNHCGLIHDWKEWRWYMQADMHSEEEEKNVQVGNDSPNVLHNPLTWRK